MKAGLLLVLHFHQPVGNFDSVIRRVHDRCYRPLLDTISKYPAIKFNMHFSGSLIDWFDSNAPETLETIRGLAASGRAELLGGGYYEPVFSIIPERDRIGQIKMMQQNMESIFGVSPKGAWIPERVWEPQMTADLEKCGVEYIVLDDAHFIKAGIKKEDTYGYYISEDNESIVRVFPSDKKLRYTIPFREAQESFSYMKEAAEKKEGAVFTYGDDAEKFGEWPGTYKLVYEDKWLEKFFDGILENKWLVTMTLSECVKKNKPLGRISLPPGSYEEMMEWCPFFRNFLVKYPESNQMHKRMLYVSRLATGLEKENPGAERLAGAKKELYKAQCNCAYWHGIFGGLYLFHLRKAVYAHLLNSQNICDAMTPGGGLKRETLDFDADGFDEVILQDRRTWLCVKPDLGGSIVEFDVKEKSFNLLNVMERRAMLAGHFLAEGTSLSDFEASGYREDNDFAGSPYELKKAGGGAKKIVMEKKGAVGGAEVRLVKEIILKDSGLSVINRITNLSGSDRRFRFGLEFPFILPNADSQLCSVFLNNDRSNGFSVGSRGEDGNVRNAEITDSEAGLGISLSFSKECALWRFPIVTASRSQEGSERNYQGSVMMPCWELELGAGKTAALRAEFNVKIYAKERV